MAPNLVASCRSKIDFLNLSKAKGQEDVLTENVARHIYAHLLGNEHVFEVLPSLNSKETAVLEALKDVTEDFKSCYSMTMFELTSSLEVSTETVGKVFLGVSNELFCEGITWSRIVTFVMFASEMTIQCLNKCLSDFVVEEIFDCFVRFIRDNLEKWIGDHGGWEGIITFSNGKKSTRSTSPSDPSSPGWAKNALHRTVRILGTLAYLANLTDPQESFPMNSN